MVTGRSPILSAISTMLDVLHFGQLIVPLPWRQTRAAVMIGANGPLL